MLGKYLGAEKTPCRMLCKRLGGEKTPFRTYGKESFNL